MSKKDRGQFYTSNHAYILEGFDKPSSKVIEPFTGKGDFPENSYHLGFLASFMYTGLSVLRINNAARKAN